MTTHELQRTQGLISLKAFTRYVCAFCFDTGIREVVAGNVLDCQLCWDKLFPHAATNGQLRAALARVIASVTPVTVTDLTAARALVTAQAKYPVPGAVLQKLLLQDERGVKAIIEHLRRRWLLPIGSSRRAPFGYYWMATPAEFAAWFNVIRAQAVSELTTAYKVMHANYAELAGQYTLDFSDQLTHHGGSPNDRDHPHCDRFSTGLPDAQPVNPTTG